MLGLSGVGCTFSPSSGDAPDAEAASSTASAVVVVERLSGPSEAARNDAIIARFLRVRQGIVDEQALRIAGVAQDLPAMGTCAARIESTDLELRAVELLDVGPLGLDDSSGRTTVLLPRAMPDPAGIVSGVFYSARSTDAFVPGARLSLHGGGGADRFEDFTVNVAAPRDMNDVRVAPLNGGLDIVWEAADSDVRDIVYVDVAGVGNRMMTRCTTFDTGRIFVASAEIGATEEGQVTVHRLHREGFRAKGIDPGEVRFDLARVVPFRR